VIALEAVIDHGIEGVIGLQVDTATITTVTPVGTPPGNIFFAAETQTAIAAFARCNAYQCFVYKFHARILAQFGVVGLPQWQRTVPGSLFLALYEKGPVN
jgi:hypothetical protein